MYQMLQITKVVRFYNINVFNKYDSIQRLFNGAEKVLFYVNNKMKFLFLSKPFFVL